MVVRQRALRETSGCVLRPDPGDNNHAHSQAHAWGSEAHMHMQIAAPPSIKLLLAISACTDDRKAALHRLLR